MSGLTGVLLAAGHGRRWTAAGGAPNKLLHRLPDGTPVVVAAARSLVSALPRSVAVVRRSDDGTAALLAECGLELLLVDDAEAGLGDNLARAVAATPDATGWVIALGDMPFIRAGSIAAVADALRSGKPLAATRHRGQRGHPVGFDASCGQALTELRGDRGAAALLQRDADRLWLVDVDDEGVLLDLDLPPQDPG
jgi:molybdenum cofactor cytidylyltransferase